MFFDECGYCETALPPTAVTALATAEDWLDEPPPRVIVCLLRVSHRARPSLRVRAVRALRPEAAWHQRAPPVVRAPLGIPLRKGAACALSF